jgi:hypothetical protein
MSMNVSMRVDTGGHKHVTEREPVRVRVSPHPVARPPRRRRNRQLIIVLTLVIMAGFLLGLGLPIHQ